MRKALLMQKAVDYERVIASAKAMSEHIGSKAALFAAAGYDGTFVEGLENAVTNLRKELDEREARRTDRNAAAAGLQQLVTRGRRLVQGLDPILSEEWAHSEHKLAKWRGLVRTEKVTPMAGEVGVTTPTEPAAGGEGEVARAA
ncbi:MAG: hypothetical protein ACT4P7_15215 [Gemmatimonadaceae bacterium]